MQCKCSRPSVLLAARGATFVALVAALPAHAQQVVLVDQTYTATSDNTEESQFDAEIKSGIPADLRAPTNYANGKVHVDLEILEAPGSTFARYNICLENSSDYACLPYVDYKGKGKYSAEPPFSDLWQYDVVDWTKGVSKVSLIIKNEAEAKVQGDASFYPYKAHLKLTVVAPGSTFDPTKGTTDTGGAAGSPATGGRGGSTGQAGSSSGGKGGSAATNANQGGSGGASSVGNNNTATAGKAAGGTGASVSGSGGAKATQPPPANAAGGAGTATSNAAVSGVDAGADKSITAQLENTSGCTVSALGAARAGSAWSLLALGLFAMRRQRRRRAC